MPGKKSGLGKGLDSLIPNKKNDISDSKVEKKQEKENDSPKSGEIMVRKMACCKTCRNQRSSDYCKRLYRPGNC